MKKPVWKRILTGLAAAALVLTAGCAGSAEVNTPPDDDSLRRVLDAGELVIGLDVEYPPMGFIGGRGEIVGFDIDMAQEVCDRLGIRLVKRPIDWEAKEELLENGEIDCIWNGMSVTPERAEAMLLSEPYIKNELIFVVREDSDAQVPQDLVGKTVGVQKGSTTQSVLEASELYGKITVAKIDDNLTLMQQLRQRAVDVAFVDSIVAYYFMFSSHERYFVLDDSLAEEKCAIGFRKGNQALRDKVQKIIGEMKGDGTLGEISKKWFGSDITIVR